VKSLLLGTAAGLVAMSGAQAADLPVKAKPVQYVKICSLYGAGFYYIPGTDMCLKIGGWVRFEAMWGANGSTTGTWNGDVNNRGTNNSLWRARGYITADARNQTEYGTIRSYIAVGVSTSSTGLDNAANQFSANRAFIQMAGFTFGLSQSFYDFYNAPAVMLYVNYPDGGTGDPGWEVASYTAQFGGGLSASFGFEQRRMTQIIDQNTVTTTAVNATGNLGGGAFSTSGNTASGAGTYGGWNMPDLVGNLRVDQAWGAAQIMGALHQVNATYYNDAAAIEGSGHPDDKYGFVVGAGLKLNAPMLGAGDWFQAQVNYTQGALRYLMFNPNGNFWMQRGQNVAYGVLSDGVYGGSVLGGTASSVELTTAWSVQASYEHFWNKQWKTSIMGTYMATSYDGAANAMLCSRQSSALAGTRMTAGSGAFSGTAALAAAGCDNNWSVWAVGSRTQYNIDSSTYLALDVVYQSMDGMSTSSGTVSAGNASTTSYPATLSTMDNWGARFRVHRDFYP
jgi:Porin subfamily